MSLSNSRSKLSLIIFVICLFFSNSIVGQQESAYNKGEVILLNSSSEKGLLWLASPSTGSSILYFKTTKNSIPKQYYPSDVISFSIDKGVKIYVTEEIPGDIESSKEFLEVLIDGKIDLLSSTNSREKLYYLRDESGMLTELENTYERPSIENNYRIQYGKEYLGELRSKLGADPGLVNNIEQAEFTDKSLSATVAKFHKINNHSYIQYPPSVLNGFFVGAGTSYSSVEHISFLNESFVSRSPFINISVFGGASLFREMLDISFKLTYSYGILFHDHNLENPGNITAFYEDMSNVSLLSNGIIFDIKPIKFGRFTPFISLGANYNLYLSYERTVVEELLDNDTHIMLSNTSEDFLKPAGFAGFIAHAGFFVDISESSSIKLNLSYNKYLTDKNDCQNAQGLSISYIRNIF